MGGWQHTRAWVSVAAGMVVAGMEVAGHGACGPCMIKRLSGGGRGRSMQHLGSWRAGNKHTHQHIEQLSVTIVEVAPIRAANLGV